MLRRVESDRDILSDGDGNTPRGSRIIQCKSDRNILSDEDGNYSLQLWIMHRPAKTEDKFHWKNKIEMDNINIWTN